MKYIEILKLEKIFGNGNENHSYFLKIEKKKWKLNQFLS